MTITKLLTGLLIGALLPSTVLADQRIEANVADGNRQAGSSLGDSKCVLVGDVIKCMPTILGAN